MYSEYEARTEIKRVFILSITPKKYTERLLKKRRSPEERFGIVPLLKQ